MSSDRHGESKCLPSSEFLWMKSRSPTCATLSVLQQVLSKFAATLLEPQRAVASAGPTCERWGKKRLEVWSEPCLPFSGLVNVKSVQDLKKERAAKETRKRKAAQIGQEIPIIQQNIHRKQARIIRNMQMNGVGDVLVVGASSEIPPCWRDDREENVTLHQEVATLQQELDAKEVDYLELTGQCKT